MSETTISRRSRVVAVTIATTTSQASVFRCEDFAGGCLSLAGASSAVTRVDVYGSDQADSPAGVLHFAGGDVARITISREQGTTTQTIRTASTATQTVTVYSARDAVYSLPAATFAARHIRLVSDADIGPGAVSFVALKS